VRRAYRGYLICHNPLSDSWWIEKGGCLISWAVNEGSAQSIVDELLAGS
jgi:hypothetical protein